MERDTHFNCIQGELTIDYRETEKTYVSQPHIHDLYELTLVLSDNMGLNINGSVTHIPPKSLLLFNNLDLHFLQKEHGGTFKRYVLQFRPEYIDEFMQNECVLFECFFMRPFDNPNILTLKNQEFDNLFSMFEKLDKISKSDIYGKNLLQKLILAEILILINGIYRTVHTLNNSYGLAAYDAIYKLMIYIHLNLSEDLSVKHLSNLSLMNERSLSKLFKEVSGMTLAQYVLYCRITKAKSLLCNDYSVERVCELSGFGNSNHFSRIFKKYVGESPKQYMMRIRKEIKL